MCDAGFKGGLSTVVEAEESRAREPLQTTHSPAFLFLPVNSNPGASLCSFISIPLCISDLVLRSAPRWSWEQLGHSSLFTLSGPGEQKVMEEGSSAAEGEDVQKAPNHRMHRGYAHNALQITSMRVWSGMRTNEVWKVPQTTV